MKKEGVVKQLNSEAAAPPLRLISSLQTIGEMSHRVNVWP